MPPVGVSPAVMEQSFTLQQSPGNRQVCLLSFQTECTIPQTLIKPSVQLEKIHLQLQQEIAFKI
jgi:hypothetical protein